MKYYPVCLQIKDRHCLVVGGGRVAERKVRGLLECEAEVFVVSPELTAGLQKLYDKKLIYWQKRGYCSADITDAALVIAATDDPHVQDMIMVDAKRDNILLNVADVPKKCNFILPALVKRGDLSIAISTSGNSPALAKKLRQEFETRIGEEYEVLNDMMGILRSEIMGRGQSQQDNERIFNQLLNDDLPAWINKNDWPSIQKHLEDVLGVLPESLRDRLQDMVLVS